MLASGRRRPHNQQHGRTRKDIASPGAEREAATRRRQDRAATEVATADVASSRFHRDRRRCLRFHQSLAERVAAARCGSHHRRAERSVFADTDAQDGSTPARDRNTTRNEDAGREGSRLAPRIVRDDLHRWLFARRLAYRRAPNRPSTRPYGGSHASRVDADPPPPTGWLASRPHPTSGVIPEHWGSPPA